VHDRDILRADPLVVRRDVAAGAIARAAKRAYDVWLAGYWWLVARLLPS